MIQKQSIIRKISKHNRKHEGQQEMQRKALDFPAQDYSKCPMFPLISSVFELYNIAHGRAVYFYQ